MSLDVYLELPEKQKRHIEAKIYVRENGQTKEISREDWNRLHPGIEPVVVGPMDVKDNRVYSANITHNLNTMAEAAGIYEPLWRPEEIGITKASELIKPLAIGLNELISEPDKYKRYNPENGWGSYEVLVEFVREYLTACQKWTNANVRVWR
jgi:hypothetical protein